MRDGDAPSLRGLVLWAKALNELTVLLADDHPKLTEMVASLLEPTFKVVGKVADGQALVEAASRLNPDLIITDISMPILDGIQAARELRKAGCTSKILLLSVHTDQDFVRACLAMSAMGFVAKPHMATDLLPAIREVLAGHTFVSSSLEY